MRARDYARACYGVPNVIANRIINDTTVLLRVLLRISSTRSSGRAVKADSCSR